MNKRFEVQSPSTRDGPTLSPKGAWAPPGPKKKIWVSKIFRKQKRKGLGPPSQKSWTPQAHHPASPRAHDLGKSIKKTHTHTHSQLSVVSSPTPNGESKKTKKKKRKKEERKVRVRGETKDRKARQRVRKTHSPTPTMPLPTPMSCHRESMMPWSLRAHLIMLVAT